MSTKNIPEEKLIILCPECRNDIPFTTLITEKDRIILNMKCICSKELIVVDLHHYLSKIKEIQKVGIYRCSKSDHYIAAQKFCEKCQQWMCHDCLVIHHKSNPLHILRNQELNLTCTAHKSSFNWYCHDCNQGFCKLCDKDHNGHQKEELNQNTFTQFISEIPNIRKVIEGNQRYKNNFNKLVDKTVNIFIQWKEEVNLVFDANERINKKLEEFCKLLQSTCELIADYPNYSLNQTLNSFTISSSINIQLESRNIEDNYVILLKHFSKEFVLKPKTDIINITTSNNIHNKTPQSNSIQCNDIQNKTKTNEQNSNFQGNIIQNKVIEKNDIRYKILCKQINSPLFQCLHKIEGHTGYVNKLIQLQNGQIASCSNDATIKIWDISSFKCVCNVKGHSSHVYSIIQLFDGRIASCGWDKTIKLWDNINYECLKTFKAHTDPVNSLIQLEDKRLGSCSVDRTIKFWDITTFVSCGKIEAHSSSVNALIQLEDKRLVSGGSDFLIKLWDVMSYKCLLKIIAHTEPVRSFSLFQDNQQTRLVSCGWDKVIKIWDISSLKNIQTIQSNCDTRHYLIHLNNNTLASCDGEFSTPPDYSIKIWKEDEC